MKTHKKKKQKPLDKDEEIARRILKDFEEMGVSQVPHKRVTQATKIPPKEKYEPSLEDYSEELPFVSKYEESKWYLWAWGILFVVLIIIIVNVITR